MPVSAVSTTKVYPLWEMAPRKAERDAQMGRWHASCSRDPLRRKDGLRVECRRASFVVVF